MHPMYVRYYIQARHSRGNAMCIVMACSMCTRVVCSHAQQWLLAVTDARCWLYIPQACIYDLQHRSNLRGTSDAAGHACVHCSGCSTSLLHVLPAAVAVLLALRES